MDSDIAKAAEGMIRAGRGDRGRLEFIRRRIQDGKKPYETDRRYVEALANDAVTYGGEANPDDDGKTATRTEMARGLLQSGLGDQGRLGHIAKTLERGGPLHVSDEEYLFAKYEECADASEAHRAAGRDAASPAREARSSGTGPEERIESAGPDAVKAGLDAVQSRIEKDVAEMAEISRYKSQLADRIKVHSDVLLNIREEVRDVKKMVKEQNIRVNEQARALDEVRSERMRLEEDSQRMVGISTELAAERKKLTAARKENRALKAKSRSLAKVQKGLEKAKRDIKVESKKIAQKIKEKEASLKEQELLKRRLEQQIAELESAREKIAENKRRVKLAEKVLQESRSHRQSTIGN